MNEDMFISASAGTGKTHRLVSEYIALLRNNPDLDLDSILAITFTERAAKEMKERLTAKLFEEAENATDESNRSRWEQLAEKSTQAWISTIHSFCMKLLSESLLYTDLKVDPGFSVVTATQGLLETQAVNEFCENNLSAIDDLADPAGLDKAYDTLANCISGNRHNLYLYKPCSHSPENTTEEKILKATESCYSAFQEINKIYEELTLRAGQLDFDQMLELTRRILKNNHDIAKRYAERFEYILVDEYQDTDELQADIIQILKDAGDVKVFYVGDDKQSIYRFRGANVAMFNRTRKNFKEHSKQTETLSTSYRSHPDLVTFCNTFFGKVMGENNSHNFVSRYEEPLQALPITIDSDQKRVRILKGPKDDKETVAAHISELLATEITFRTRSGKKERRKARPGDIALLFRKLGSISEYEHALEANEIPYYTIGSKSLFERSEITGLIALIKFLGNPQDDSAFLSFFLSPAWAGTLEEALMIKAEFRHFSDALRPDGNPATEELRILLDRYASLARVLRPGELIETFVEENDYLPKMMMLEAPQQRVANVVKFLQISRKLDDLGTNLREFSNNIERYIKSSQEGEAALESERSDSVKLMSIHQSKGLEFPIVVIPEMIHEKNKDPVLLLFDENSREFIVNAGDDKVSMLKQRIDLEKKKDEEEEKRVLYVALTRARDMLVMSINSELKPGSTKPWVKALLKGLYSDDLQEIDGSLKNIIEFVTPSKDMKMVKHTPVLAEPSSWHDPSPALVKDFQHTKFQRVHSPTTIIKEESAAQSIYYPELSLTEGSPASALGQYAHLVLEKLGGTGSSTMCEILNNPPDHNGCGITTDEAREVIERLRKLSKHPAISEIENSTRCHSEELFEKPLGKYVLRGLVDKLYETGKGWKIVDFKFAEKSPDRIQDYVFQMKFYLYLLSKDLGPVSATLLFLKDGQTEIVTLDDEKAFERELLKSIEKMQNQESYKLC